MRCVTDAVVEALAAVYEGLVEGAGRRKAWAREWKGGFCFKADTASGSNSNTHLTHKAASDARRLLPASFFLRDYPTVQ